MHHRVLRSLFVATTALLLTTTACDSGAEQPAKTDDKAEEKAEEKKTDDKAAEAGEAAAAEAGAAAAEAGEVAAEAGEAAAEAGEAAAEAGEAAAEAGEVAAEAGAAEAGEAAAEAGEAAEAGDKAEGDKAEPEKKDGGGSKTAAAPKVDGKPIFESKCKSCHGIKGDSDTTIGKKLEIPALKGTKLSKSKISGIVTNGVSGTKMKAYKDKLSADEIAGVAAYVKKL